MMRNDTVEMIHEITLSGKRRNLFAPCRQINHSHRAKTANTIQIATKIFIPRIQTLSKTYTAITHFRFNTHSDRPRPVTAA